MVHSQRSFKLVVGILCFLLLQACQAPVAEETATEVAITHHELPEILLKTLDAHGGMEQWRTFQSLSYAVNFNDRLMDQQRVDLPSRKVLISGEDFRLGFDGTDVWYIGRKEQDFPAGSARFYHNLHFYFFAMPFVFADPGLQYQSLGKKSFRGIDYDVLQITYKNGVGDSPDDEYIIYLHPETHQMTLLLYTVTYFSKQESREYSARFYKDWQWVNGMLVPYICEKYQWQGDSLGELQYTNSYTDVLLDALPVDQSMFLAPAEASISY